MSQTVPFQVVIATQVVPKQPFANLYQHIRQRDPKLAETIDSLAVPPNLQSNLVNPLQCFTAIFSAAIPGATTNWGNVLSNVPTDKSLYLPILAYANVDVPSSTDVIIDIQVSHDESAHFFSILNPPGLITIPAGQNFSLQIVSFVKGAYLRNLDLVYFQMTSAAFDGGNITGNLLFQ